MLRIDLASIDVVSTDVFDTMLWRNRRCETARCLERGRLVGVRLRELGYRLSAEVLFHARRAGFALAYRSAEMFRPSGEVGLGRIIRLQAALLGLNGAASEALLGAELECERRSLIPNRAVVDYLAVMLARGKRVIAIGDTDTAGPDLAALVAGLALGRPVARFYSSSDAGATKRSGRLLQLVACAERAAVRRIFHFGDNWHSDVAMARQIGFQAQHLPRSRAVASPTERVATAVDRAMDGAVEDTMSAAASGEVARAAVVAQAAPTGAQSERGQVQRSGGRTALG